MSKQRSKAVFLDTDNGTLYKKLYGGIPFSVEKLEDKSIKVKVADQDTEISSPQTNDYGTYFIVSVFGGKGFVSFRPSKTGNGDYCLMKLTEDCALPPPIKAESKAPSKKQYGNKAATPW